MNYIELINRFWKVDLEFSFSGSETRLYMYLLHVSNTMAWKNPMRLSCRQVELGTGLAPNTLRAARIRLKKAGLIEFKTGRAGNSKNFDNKTVYELLCSKTEHQAERQTGGQAECQTHTVNKLESINLNNIPPISPRGESVATGVLSERAGMEACEGQEGVDCRKEMGRKMGLGEGDRLSESGDGTMEARNRDDATGGGDDGVGKKGGEDWKAVGEKNTGEGEAVGGTESRGTGADFADGSPEDGNVGGRASGGSVANPAVLSGEMEAGGNAVWKLEFEGDFLRGKKAGEAAEGGTKPEEGRSAGNGRDGRGKADKPSRGKRTGQRGRGRAEEGPLKLPFESETFRQTWTLLAGCPKWRGKTRWALVQALNQLGRYEEEFAVLLMETAVANDWQGVVFPETADRYRAWKAVRKGGGRPSPGRLNIANHNNDKTYENF